MMLYVIAAAALALSPSSRFELRDPDSGALLARGVEQVRVGRGSTTHETTYTDTRATASHRESFAVETTTGRFESYAFLSDSGERIDVASKDGSSLEVHYRERQESDVTAASLPFGNATIVGKALPDLVLTHWDALRAGDTVRFDLVVPSRLETIRFRLRRRASRVGHAEFLAEADSWIIRQFAPDLTLTFADAENATERRLIELIGPSPIELGGRRHSKIRLVMLYD